MSPLRPGHLNCAAADSLLSSSGKKKSSAYLLSTENNHTTSLEPGLSKQIYSLSAVRRKAKRCGTHASEFRAKSQKIKGFCFRSVLSPLKTIDGV